MPLKEGSFSHGNGMSRIHFVKGPIRCRQEDGRRVERVRSWKLSSPHKWKNSDRNSPVPCGRGGKKYLDSANTVKELVLNL